MKQAFILLSLLFIPLTASANDADAILGIWKTDEGDSMEIFKCDDHYCARISDLVEKIYPADDAMAGKPKVDRENPDESKRDQPIIGLQFMSGFTFNGKIWSGGSIYDPNNGKTYKCKITMVNDKKLKVRGYIGVSVLGRTEIWTR
ncbi:MAG: DUF2147 domain-containing protein [Acidobacteriota bacterium]|nr:DUF2147 domain-containing protein [Acidobacteriota bacterium]